MILYNTHESKGAADAAQKMELSLQAAGFLLLVKVEWKSEEMIYCFFSTAISLRMPRCCHC